MALPATVGGNITAADINTISAFPVANFAALPTIGNFVGRQVATLDTGITHRWNGSAWVLAFQVHAAAITAKAGYTVTEQQVLRQDRHIHILFAITKASGNWALEDVADVVTTSLRPDSGSFGLPVFGMGRNMVTGASVSVALFQNGTFQVQASSSGVGTNALAFSVSYLVETL